MTKQTRRHFFYMLIFLFAIASPVLIFYSLGYTIDFSKISIEKTGGIFIKSKIHTVSVFLDGIFIKETPLFTSGTLLTDLKPRTHLLRLEKIGFHPWFKTVEVVPMNVIELRNVLLVPNPIPISTSTPDEIKLIYRLSLPVTPPIGWKIDKKERLIQEKNGESKIIASNINSFDVINSKVYWVDKNGFLARLEPDTGIINNIGRPGFYLNKTPIRFISSPQGNIFLIDSSGGLFILEEEKITPLGGGVRHIKFDNDAEKIIFQKERSIEVWWFKDESYQPFRKKGDRETILNLSNEIKNAEWFYGDDAHIIIQARDGIFLTELDGRGGRNTVELVSGKTEIFAATPDIPNAIFFRKEKAWFKIQL